MDPILSSIGSLLTECRKVLCGSVYFNIKNFFEFGSNVDTLNKEIRSLKDLKKQIEEEIRLAEMDGGKRTNQVTTWLRKVEEIELVVNPVLAEVMPRRQNPNGYCLNCSLHFRMSRKLVKDLKKVKQIMDESSSHQVVMVDSRVKPVEQLPGPSIVDQNIASQNISRILDLLKDDVVRTIGIVGMGGVGKTTLIRNLNNKLESMNSTQPFSMVIWITVSRDMTLERVQNRIAERLNMMKISGESIDGKAIRTFNRLKREKKFILILDDVWERIDLDKIGIPRPADHVGSKIILTTRSLDVCREMETDIPLHVAVLSSEESWSLFCQSAGETFDSEDVRPFAEAVAKECGGLPLAIITLGRAMRGKKKIESWKDALRALKRSNPVPYIRGIEKEVFLPLKWSYDSLEGKNIQPCFLYCCLYPEDFSIDTNELLHCWIAERLVDIEEDLEEAYRMGTALIENLKDSCLLECGNRDGTVKMHDVVRDVAIWIASSSQCEHKSFIQAGFGLSQLPRVETWGSYKRVSFMYNSIELLPASVSQYSHEVSTLLVQGNALESIPVGFLRGFRSLVVLNLSETNIKSLPLVDHLGELRALFLKNCYCLRDFPPLRRLSRLQMLDLSGNRLDMSPDDAAQMLNELRFQEHLLELYVHLYHAPSITLEDSVWLKRLKRFTISIGFDAFTADTYFTTYNEKTVYLSGLKSTSEAITVLWSNASTLVLYMCQCITEMWTSTSFGVLDCLKSLTIDICFWTGSMGVTDFADDELVLLPSIELLRLCNVANLCSISNLLNQFGGKIRVIKVEYCHDLKHLFPFDALEKVETLEEIYVNNCMGLTEIITEGSVCTDALPNLQIMKLAKLPKLRRFYHQQGMFGLCLNRIEVEDCPVLKKLPLSSQHANTIKVIKGDLGWWDQLQWDNDDTKSSLEQCFQPLSSMSNGPILDYIA